MQMYEVAALAEDMCTEIYRSIVFADNEDEALNEVQEHLKKEAVSYGMCLAEEIN